jgi:hypothetical protein
LGWCTSRLRSSLVLRPRKARSSSSARALHWRLCEVQCCLWHAAPVQGHSTPVTHASQKAPYAYRGGYAWKQAASLSQRKKERPCLTTVRCLRRVAASTHRRRAPIGRKHLAAASALHGGLFRGPTTLSGHRAPGGPWATCLARLGDHLPLCLMRTPLTRAWMVLSDAKATSKPFSVQWCSGSREREPVRYGFRYRPTWTSASRLRHRKAYSGKPACSRPPAGASRRHLHSF